jgi:hypothetical protein
MVISCAQRIDLYCNDWFERLCWCVGTVVFGDFEWDAEKAAANRAKHTVAFEEAAEAMLDPLSVDFDDIACPPLRRDSIHDSVHSLPTEGTLEGLDGRQNVVHRPPKRGNHDTITAQRHHHTRHRSGRRRGAKNLRTSRA